MTTRGIISLLVLATAACAPSWPEPGGGGMAEHAWPAQAAAEAQPDPSPRLRRIELHLDCSLRRWATLSRDAEAAGRGQGQVSELDLLAVRAEREFAGGLPEDAERTLSLFDQRVAGLSAALHLASGDPGPCMI